LSVRVHWNIRHGHGDSLNHFTTRISQSANEHKPHLCCMTAQANIVRGWIGDADRHCRLYIFNTLRWSLCRVFSRGLYCTILLSLYSTV